MIVLVVAASITPTASATPAPAGDVIGVSAGAYHTCVLRETGNVDCYGSNEFGQAADYLGGDATAVAAGHYHTCVLKETGNVDCYGRNDDGQAADYLGGDATAVAARG
ncbi:MAG TPA: RCC1 domain-containing protein, partial [Candidatus Thermoplasmatota archaeon]|nr:RCC1 domain-containing protein [Candidatus Thermoplasmatota archaeon]